MRFLSNEKFKEAIKSDGTCNYCDVVIPNHKVSLSTPIYACVECDEEFELIHKLKQHRKLSLL